MTDFPAVVLARRNQHFRLDVEVLSIAGALLVGETDLVRTERVRLLIWAGAPAMDIAARVTGVDVLEDGKRAVTVSFVDAPEHVVERLGAIVREQLARTN